MATRISEQELVNKVRLFLKSKANEFDLDPLIKEALVMADRELRTCDSLSPLAWHIHPYDELRSVYPADISDITAASPGVVTAASQDSDVSGHGFHNHSTIQDVVIIDGLDEPAEINGRPLLLVWIDADTFSLKTLDGLAAINTGGYSAYTSGGTVYHAGFVLNTTTILSGVSSVWGFGGLTPGGVTFDGYQATVISENEVKSNRKWTDISTGGRPSRYRYWQNITAVGSSPTISHYLLWYPIADQPYNIALRYLKDITDMATWSSTTYPFHPAEVHDALWHGALANLVGNSKRMERQSATVLSTKVEVMWAQRWLQQWAQDKLKVIQLSRAMLGQTSGATGRGFSG